MYLLARRDLHRKLPRWTGDSLVCCRRFFCSDTSDVTNNQSRRLHSRRELWWGPKNLQPNDIVVFRSPQTDSHPVVMRVVGLPGDRIEIADEKVLLDGEEWPDSHALFDQDAEKHPMLSDYGPTTIPSDCFFGLGDNRRRSKDSRAFGPVPLSSLIGKARMIYWSREQKRPDPQDSSQAEAGKIGWERIGMRLD
ncbi:MAG: signal peptidase I [Verrucomicrobiota bacterium]